MIQFDEKQLKVVGEEKILINGGTDLSKKPYYIEGPHLLKKDGWYYLICAEGGTQNNHSEVVFRSRQVDGPYVSYEKNPLITQRHLNSERPNPVTSTGHADFVEDTKGNWWAVFLGCRPYTADYYNTGRETFMAPVEWNDGWPVINLGGDEVKYSYPIAAVADKSIEKFNGNYFFRDDFKGKVLNNRYTFLRTVWENWYSLSKKEGTLSVNLRPQTVQGKDNPSFIGFRQTHLKGHAATAMQFKANAEHEKAGLLVFANENHFYFLCKSVQDGKDVVQLYKAPGNKKAGTEPELLASQAIKANGIKDLFLKVEANGSAYSFYFALKKNRWKPMLLNADAKFLSTKEAGGFVGCMYAMYATSSGKPSENAALFQWFENRNNDDVYRSPF
jgi:alpha-N-arabinofuranosidase